MSEYVGRVSGLAMEKYHSYPALSSSALKQGLETMADFKAHQDGKIKFKSTAALDLGTCVHSAILEQDLSGFRKGPDVKTKASKEWKAFDAECFQDGVIGLKPEEYETVRDMYEAFFAHPLAPKIIKGGVAEESFFSQDPKTGIELKARPDYLVESEEGNYIVNLKTSRDSKERAFVNDIYKYRYDFSEAHYMATIFEACGLRIKEALFIVIEKEAPFHIGIYRATDTMIERALERRRMVLDEIFECQKVGVWPGRKPEIIDVELPNYGIEKEELILEANIEIVSA